MPFVNRLEKTKRSKEMNNSQKTFLFCTALVVFATVTRIISAENQWWNFASLGAISLFSGAMFKNKPYALALPLLALLASDIYVEITKGYGFYGVSQYFVYGSMVLIVLLGGLMKRINVINVLGLSVAGSLVFFLLTNFGTWFAGFYPTATVPAMYPMNLAGLMTCMEMGIPFYKNTLISDVLFSGVLFGAYALFQSLSKSNIVAKAA